VQGLEHISGTPVEIARRLRRNVLDRVGLPITVGVARTKFLAKVASQVAKPDGLLFVPPGRELAFLHPLPVERLWASARSRRRSCTRGESRPTGQVARLEEATLVAMLGRASGRHLHALLQATHHTDAILATARGLLAASMPLDGRDRAALDAALDEIRERFGTSAVTRGILVGRHPGLTMPLLPD